MPTFTTHSNGLRAFMLRRTLATPFNLSAVSMGLLLSVSQVVQAQDQAFDIPAQPLNAALQAFGQQANVQVLYQSADVLGRKSTAVRGAMPANTAVTQLLSGSGLRYSLQGDTLTVYQASGDASAINLDSISVQGTSLGATTEGTGSYTTGSTSTATKMPMSLRETPQSVTVVTRQKMDDQNVQSLDDVARTTTGITYTKIGTERSTYYARGFEINDLQFDGIPSNISENYSMDVMSTANMAIYDRIEVVRGANGLMQGTGNPSAAINLVRKRPTKDFRLGAELGAGSWDNYRSQIDVSGPLTEDGRFRGRAVAYYNTANSYRDGAEKDNQLLYLVGEADLDDSTVLTIGATVQQDRNNGYDWGGLNTKADGSFYPLSRSDSLAGKWAYLDRTNYTMFGDITHHFDNDWKLTFAANGISSGADFLSSYPSRASGDTYNLPVSKVNYDDRQYGLDVYATGPFSMLGREHQLMLGANTRRDAFDAYIYQDVVAGRNSVTLPGYDWSSIGYPNINYGTRNDYKYVREEKGVYAATRLSVTDDLSVILGSRVSWADYEVQSPYTNDSYSENRHVIPYAGVVYDLSDNHTLYASYTEIYKTQSYFAVGNTLLDPVDGENYEIGLKSEYFDGRLNTSFAIFQTDLNHMPEAVDGPKVCGVTQTSSCYEEGGKVRNRGFEIEASGQPLEGWNLSAGYTYSDPEYVAGAKKGQDYYSYIPRRLLKVSTDYKLPGDLSQWRVGGDVYAQSETRQVQTAYTIRQGGYALLNLHLNYQIDKQFSVQYNLNNALDKVYYQSLPTSNNFGGLFYGDPRNFAVTLRYQY